MVAVFCSFLRRIAIHPAWCYCLAQLDEIAERGFDLEPLNYEPDTSNTAPIRWCTYCILLRRPRASALRFAQGGSEVWTPPLDGHAFPSPCLSHHDCGRTGRRKFETYKGIREE
jgi:hypothetical protein